MRKKAELNFLLSKSEILMRWHLSPFTKAEPHRWIISAGSTLIAIHWGLKLTHSPLPAHAPVCILVYVCICPCMNALCGGQDSAQCLPLLFSICACVGSGNACHVLRMWRSKENSFESVLSFYFVGLRNLWGLAVITFHFWDEVSTKPGTLCFC